MIVYSNMFKNSSIPTNDMEFEVLNELKDLSHRTDDNCLYHNRFLFECDFTDLDEQKELAYRLEKIACRATFSGSKSIHVIMAFDIELDDICKTYYKEIWKAINQNIFDGKADKACANPSRLTRRPGARRKDKGGVEQYLLYRNSNKITKNSQMFKHIWRAVRAEIAMKAISNISNEQKSATSHSKSNHDGLCANYDVVTHYLNTSYTKMKGNGDSSISLFKAIRVCLKYGDELTLNRILHKATSEHWSISELERIQRNIRQKYV